MKKSIFFLIAIAIIFVACKSRNNEKKSGALAGFSSYYNTLFNSKDALETEINQRKKNHKENFYDSYIPLLKYDEVTLDQDGEAAAMFNPGAKNNASKSASTLQISEAKALKAISKYSVMKEGEEKNKQIFNAHLLLAQARLYMGKPLEALDALNYIFTKMPNDKRINLAKIYQAHILTKMNDFYRANEIFLDLKEQRLKKEYHKLYSIYFSEMLIASGKKEEAVEELEEAFQVNKNREMRSRIAYLRGQLLAELGRNEEARESFTSAYKYANNFEFEVKSQIEIAKTFTQGSDDYEGAKKYIESIGKKGTYTSRKNEFLYALGLMANRAGKPDEAQDFFKKATKEKVSDPQVRGLTYYEMGKFYTDKNDYISAGAYYDSALSVMTHEPTRAKLAKASKSMKDIATNFYLVKTNDSIIALTKMSEPERIAYFTKHIDALKAKEAKEEAERKKAERNKGFEDGDYNANSIFANNRGNNFQDFSTNQNKNAFYFANQNTVSKGQVEFKQIWGNRSLGDNWRMSNKTASLEDVKNEALGLSSAPNPRRFETDFYIEQIPTNAVEIADLKKARDTASLGLGRIYDEYFSDRELATKTLYDLVEQNPEEDVKLQALYRIFVMNYENNPSAAERAKQLILNDFPYTSYAEFVRNPKNTNFSKSSPEVEEAYQKAFDLYSQNQFEESKAVITKALEQYPNDALVPKFALLEAYNTGKTVGKEIMILQLQQIALNYAKTNEGLKAQELLRFLKSDIDVKMTDQAGNTIPTKSNQPPVQKNDDTPMPAFNPTPVSRGENAKKLEKLEKPQTQKKVSWEGSEVNN